MKTLRFLPLLIVLSVYSIQAVQPGYVDLKNQAERLFAEGSYSKAHEVYEQASKLSLNASDSRWVHFRLADTEWRAQSATNTSDNSKYDEAREQLESLVRDIKRVEDRDNVWAEVYESLGDFWWIRNESRNWGQAWPNYQYALDWWSGSQEMDSARDRYLGIVWKIAKDVNGYSYYASYAPLDVFENAAKIARTPDDKAHAHFLLAMRMLAQGGLAERRRLPQEFEAAMEAGKSSKWFDEVLYQYGYFMANQGSVEFSPDGQWRQQPDYEKGLELFRKLVTTFRKGESQYWDPANQQIAAITKPSLDVGVGNIFLPGSEIQFALNWRNVKSVSFSLYRVSLIRDIRFNNRNEGTGDWVRRISTATAERIKSWSKETGDKGGHQPGSEYVTVDGKLAPGAYLIEARSGSVSSRDLILVSDAAVVLKASHSKAVVYFCNALDGSPIAGASVKLWRRNSDNDNPWILLNGRTNQDGIADFEMPHGSYNAEIFAAASNDDRQQAFSAGYGYGYSPEGGSWRIYAFTDRPAYRPGESVQWKFVARKNNGQVYSTPGNQTIIYKIVDPRGSEVKQESIALNAFGSAWGSFELGENWPLGEYRIAFEDQGNNSIGAATLFRLEEYKLPEFKVAVKTPEAEGRKKTFRLGDKVEANIQADYYSGGPVANATVEVLVYQNPYYHYWTAPRDYSWYYSDETNRYNYGGRNGQVIKRETLKTDATGKATISFDTTLDSQSEFEYRIEARVTDSSRREILGEDSVRVTRQSYYVYPQAQHNLYHPHDRVGIDIAAMDANNQPVEVAGKLKVTRDYWYEIWLDPSGREVKGDELKRVRAANRIFPPAPTRPDQKPWQLKFQGYEHDDILAESVKTDAQGKLEFSFQPEREGYYRVAWTSADSGSLPIQAETTVWIATTSSTDLGYNYGGLQIIVDKDTFHAGQKVPVMLVAPSNGRYVLFGVEGNDIYSCQLVRMTGNVKLIELPLSEKDVPNMFLSAAMVSDGQLFTDQKEAIVPPVDQFLSVDIKPDRAEYKPRDEATLTVTTRDHNGRPVAAEVALGMVDQSVFYIQGDYAGDPRKFYYGEKRQQYVQTVSSFQWKAYTKLVKDDQVGLVDIKAQERGKNQVGFYAYLSTGRRDGTQSAIQAAPAESKAAAGALKDEENLPLNGRDMDRMEKLKKSELAPASTALPPPPGQPESPAVLVRHDFRSTAVWKPDVVTDSDGIATVKVKMPESLTAWTATARAITAGSQFGIADATARTNQPLIVRLEAPRFFVVGDTATVSAVINNNSDKPMRVSAALGAEGVQVTGAAYNESEYKAGEKVPVEVPGQGEVRVDWTVQVRQAGTPSIRVTAEGADQGDAMERSFIAYEHGLEKFVSRSGKVRGNSVAVSLQIPAARKPETTSLEVQVSPSMAVTLLDSLPYLIDYPYGCTEQTMSRFLPAAITAKTLRELGLKPADIAGKMFGGIEPATASATHPKGAHDLKELDAMIKQGLVRLYSFQHDDGGWGWWKEDPSDHFMTAYVVWGLSLAGGADINVDNGRLERAAQYLNEELIKEKDSYDEQAWMLHALAAYKASRKETGPSEYQENAFKNLWEHKDNLNAYTRSLLALAAHDLGFNEQAKTLIDNLENGAVIDNAPDTSVIQSGQSSAKDTVMGTAHWGEDGVYWRWSDGGIEATAFALRAMLAIDPENKLVEPVTNWLIKNRRGAQWTNTRDTAISVLALDGYLRQSGELQPDCEYELVVNGQSIIDRKLTTADALSAPSRFLVPAELIKDGANEISINRKSGTGALYFAANAKFFSLEEPVTPAGNEIFARRDYYRLVAHSTLLKGYVYERRLLRDGDTVNSGDRIETVVTIESKNNYEYLMFEDLKPAGLEAAEVRSDSPLFAAELRTDAIKRKFSSASEGSGESKVRQSAVVGAGYENDNGAYGEGESGSTTGRTAYVHQELRDRKVALFIDHLPQGVWQIHYDMRAEVPGQFHALPVTGQAMYVPEIRCNGQELRLKVAEAPAR